MKTSIDIQLVQIGICWLAGFLAGFLYDAFRVLRRESGLRVLTGFLDSVFCAAVCFALFIIGMSAGDGSVSIAMLVFAAIGFACYILTLSGPVFGLFRKVFAYIKILLSPIGKILSASSKMTKSGASKVLYWLKIKVKARKKNGGKALEKAENAHNSGYRNYGDADLWNSLPDIGNGAAE